MNFIKMTLKYIFTKQITPDILDKIEESLLFNLKHNHQMRNNDHQHHTKCV